MFRDFYSPESDPQDHAVLILLLYLVEVCFFISIWPRWSDGNVLYHSCTSFEGASRRGQPLYIFAWFIGAGGTWNSHSPFLERTRILNGIRSTTHFIEFFVAETKRFVGSFVTVILTRQTCGQRSSRACESKRQALGNYFSERICYMFLWQNVEETEI